VENGSTALKLALLAAGIGDGDEVVVPGMTWPSVAGSVLECRAVPVLVDVDLETFAIDPKLIEVALTDRTKALVPTHLFSSQADLPPIIQVATERSLQIIEDCAHVPGAKRFGRSLGTFGRAAIFSFNQKKLLACGEGGCLITDDLALFEIAAALRDFESAPKGFVPGTHTVSEFQAAVLRSQLKKLPGRLELMEERAERLRSNLLSGGRVSPLARLPGTNRQTFYNFCFRVEGVADITGFRRAVAAEVNLPMAGGYRPLNEVPVLDTENDRRFKGVSSGLSTDLPKCRIAHYQQAVRFRHNALMADESAIDDIARAIEKVLESARFKTPPVI